VTLSELDGVRYLHFGTEWVQGAMRIRKPNWPELEYAQQMMAWMLWQEQPRRIAQLGLGTAALTKFCYATFPDAQVTAIELNPSVIAICESMFKLPPNDERLQVLEHGCARLRQRQGQRRHPGRAAGRPVRRHRARPGAGHPSSTRPAMPA
jgi:spermidine synthase